MSDVPRLSSYPYVNVRVTCSQCTRKGSYKLARLAARFGPEAALVDVLRELSRDCPNSHGYKRQKGVHLYCGAVFGDLESPRPPDVPPERPPPGAPGVRLRVVGER